MQKVINNNQPFLAAGWMTLALLSFTVLAVSVRELSADYSVYQILGIRSALGLLFLTLFIYSKDKTWFNSHQPKKQILRNLFHFLGQYLWVIGIVTLPLAEVFALEFTTPIWGALLAWIILGERFTFARKLALVCGFTGVLMIVKPGSGIFQAASILVIFSAMLFALSMLFVKQLSKHDSAATILFYFCLVQMPMGLIPAISSWTSITSESIIWFILVSISGLTAHVGITKAIQCADLMLIQPMDFLRVPLIALVGFYLYQETFDLWLILGAFIIFSGNFYSLKNEISSNN